TDAPRPVADPLPRRVRALLAVPRERRTPAENAAVFSWWRTTVPEWKKDNAKIEALWKGHPAGTSQLTLAARERPRTTFLLAGGGVHGRAGGVNWRAGGVNWRAGGVSPRSLEPEAAAPADRDVGRLPPVVARDGGIAQARPGQPAAGARAAVSGRGRGGARRG